MRRVVAGAAVIAVVAGLVGWAAWPALPSWRTSSFSVTTEVRLDATFSVPRDASPADPVPAVPLAHGFGDSGGQIHLNSPDHEVRDAQRLLDRLAARPEVRRDGAGTLCQPR